MLVSLARRRQKLGLTGGARKLNPTRAKARGQPPPADDARPF